MGEQCAALSWPRRLLMHPWQKPKPFLDEARRDWQFAAFAWLLRNCGGYPKFLETTLVLPPAGREP